MLSDCEHSPRLSAVPNTIVYSPHHNHLLLQGNRQVTRAAIEFYGPDRAKFLGEYLQSPSVLLPCSLTASVTWCPVALS